MVSRGADFVYGDVLLSVFSGFELEQSLSSVFELECLLCPKEGYFEFENLSGKKAGQASKAGLSSQNEKDVGEAGRKSPSESESPSEVASSAASGSAASGSAASGSAATSSAASGSAATSSAASVSGASSGSGAPSGSAVASSAASGSASGSVRSSIVSSSGNIPEKVISEKVQEGKHKNIIPSDEVTSNAPSSNPPLISNEFCSFCGRRHLDLHHGGNFQDTIFKTGTRKFGACCPQVLGALVRMNVQALTTDVERDKF